MKLSVRSCRKYLSLGAVVTVVAILGLFFPSNSYAVINQSITRPQQFDVNHEGVSVNGIVLQPKYWQLYDTQMQTLDEQPVGRLLMIDQAELNSPVTRYVAVIQSTGAGIFGLPSSVTAKLTPADLVNFYLYKSLKSSVSGKVTRAGIVTINEKKAYFVDWNHVKDGVLFFEMDYFIFDGSVTYQLRGSYPSYASDKKLTIEQVIQSFRIR